MHLIKGRHVIQLDHHEENNYSLCVIKDTLRTPPYRYNVEVEVPDLNIDDLERLSNSLANTIKYQRENVFEGAPTMDMQEFIDEGYLHEINRKFLHPLGLALALDPDNMTNTCIIDARDDPEGMRFADDTLSADKAANIREVSEKLAGPREAALGYVIQPVKESK